MKITKKDNSRKWDYKARDVPQNLKVIKIKIQPQ